jgi:hypothetical protein
VLHGEAWYDNTAENDENPNSPPDWVWLGESTTNEMMLFYFAYTFGFPTDTNIVVDNSAHPEHYQDCLPLLQVGIPDERTIPELLVWPAPARDVLYVRTEDPNGELILTDMSGRVVERKRLSGPINNLVVGDLARGMYLVQQRSGTGIGPPTKVILE